MEIRLLEPAHDMVTAPLQRFSWPLNEEAQGCPAVQVPMITWDALNAVAEDRSLPCPVTFRWEAIPAQGAVRYDLLLATEPTFAAPRRFAGLREQYTDVWHLHLDTRYYWTVQAKLDGRLLATAPTGHVMTHPAPPRWIHVPGITNVRDMGGWPVREGRIRQGLLYRTSEMNAHLQISEEGRQLLYELGIRTDIDLRGESENTVPVLDARVRWVNIPVKPYQAFCEDDPRGSTAYRRLFIELANPENYPLMFHCWGGADRAGTFAFLIGALLGMSLDDLIRDYELTTLSIWGPRRHTSPEFSGMLDALRAFGPDPLDIYALVEAYLSAIGITRAEMQTIRETMVEAG